MITTVKYRYTILDLIDPLHPVPWTRYSAESKHMGTPPKLEAQRRRLIEQHRRPFGTRVETLVS